MLHNKCGYSMICQLVAYNCVFSIKIKFSNNNNNIIKIEVKLMKEINIVNRDFDSFNIQR